MKRILYATDASDSAQYAGRYAAKLLEGWPQAELLGLYVTQEIAFPYRVNLSDVDEQRERHHANRVKEQVYASLPQSISKERVSFLHEVGRPPQVICSVAEENRADLIVMGSHGYHFVDRIILGSVSQEVLHRSNVPVLIVPAAANPEATAVTMRKILFAADGSPETAITGAAVRELLETWPEAECTVLYVQRAIQPYYRDTLTRAIVNEEERWAKELENVLYEEIFHGLGDRIQFQSVPGNPASTICSTALQGQFDLVVVGSHGFKPAESFFYGSVRNAVAQRSRVPVLVVKSPMTEGENEATVASLDAMATQKSDLPSYPPYF